MRKEPFTTTGRRVNVLLMNEDGVLTDRTTQYAAASGVPGDQGFLTPTNDRDVVVVDVNDDGFDDIVRLTSNGDPYHVGVAYNNPANQGFFTQYAMVYVAAPYHSEVSDLNGDGRLDFVAIDDGTDRYLLNQGNDPEGRAVFSQFVFPPETGVANAGNVVVHDLDQDGLRHADLDAGRAGRGR